MPAIDSGSVYGSFQDEVALEDDSELAGLRVEGGVKGHKLKPAVPADIGCGVHILVEGREREYDRYQWPLAPKRAMTMKELARELSILTGTSPVQDLTGLGGEYKINLSFTRRPDSTDYPSLEAALQEQLGLVMRLAKGDRDVLIVDSVEKPTAN